MRPRGPAIVLALGALLGLPAAVEAQRPAWEIRVGVAWHGTTVCNSIGVGRSRGLTGGIEARTRGAWIASAAADLILDNWKLSCIGVELVYDYQGREVTFEGESSPFARLRVEAGHTITIGGFRSELTGGAGLFPTLTYYGVGGNDFSWEPWYGGTLTVRLPGSRTGMQIELGRHRLTRRYYEVGTRALVAEIHYWRPLTRLGVSFPL